MTPNASTLEQHDQTLHWRCPQLGGEVPFRYCRTLVNDLPCRRIAGCWKTMLDIQAFLEAHYGPADLDAAWDRSNPGKMVQLADLIAQARQSSADHTSI